jgi:hypothetical protein
LAYVKKELQ